MTEIDRPQDPSRRDAFKRAGLVAGGAAAVWAAPSITTLGSAAFAMGSEQPGDRQVFFDNFDQDTAQLRVRETRNFILNARATNVDVIGDQAVTNSPGFEGQTFDPFPGNGNYIDLDGTGSTGVVNFTTKTGFPVGNYRVAFVLGGGNDTNNVTASLGGGSLSVSTSPRQPAVEYSFLASVTTEGSRLTFSQPTGDNQGAILLEVRVFSRA